MIFDKTFRARKFQMLWVVFVPNKTPGRAPEGTIIRMHKQTGEVKIDMNL